MVSFQRQSPSWNISLHFNNNHHESCIVNVGTFNVGTFSVYLVNVHLVNVCIPACTVLYRLLYAQSNVEIFVGRQKECTSLGVAVAIGHATVGPAW